MYSTEMLILLMLFRKNNKRVPLKLFYSKYRENEGK